VLDYRLRAATAGDAQFLADVVFEATRAQGRVPPDFDEPEWREMFGRQTMEQIRGEVPGSTTSVIETGSERAGRLRIIRTASCIELAGIQILPRRQRHGIGTAIIEDLKAQAEAAGVPLELAVEKDNPDARRLYERLGFVRAGETEQEFKLRWSPRLSRTISLAPAVPADDNTRPACSARAPADPEQARSGRSARTPPQPPRSTTRTESAVSAIFGWLGRLLPMIGVLRSRRGPQRAVSARPSGPRRHACRR